MPTIDNFRTWAAGCGPVALALLLAGCGGNPSQPVGPKGDNTGEHLLIYTSDAGRPAGEHGIVLYDFDRNVFHALPNLDAPGSEFDPCLSNDGNFITFSATRGATGSDIYVYDRLNEGLLPTPGLNSAQDETWPRFTFDSVKLAFVRRLATGEKRVRLYEPVGDTLISLPGLDAGAGENDDEPAPNQDGTRIAFMSDRGGGGTHDILVWTRGQPLAVIPELASAGDDIEPSLSPDGNWLAFASNRAGGQGGYDIYLYSFNAHALVNLAAINSAGNDRHPSISADGDVIAFQSDRAGGGGATDLSRYVVSTAGLSQPAPLKAASDDISPYLRWR